MKLDRRVCRYEYGAAVVVLILEKDGRVQATTAKVERQLETVVYLRLFFGLTMWFFRIVRVNHVVSHDFSVWIREERCLLQYLEVWIKSKIIKHLSRVRVLVNTCRAFNLFQTSSESTSIQCAKPPLSTWLTTIFLIFGVCCSNAITLERLTLRQPNSGSALTLLQFLLIP